MIKITALEKYYGDSHVLKDIDLEVAAGEVVSLIGPSGAGKSTLLRCMNLLEVPDAGEIAFDGDEVEYRVARRGRLALRSRFALTKLRAEVGMVFQQFHLWPQHTVLKNITEGQMVVRRAGREPARERALQLLEKVGLQDKAHVYPADLSGGQQQRVAICRALAMEPKVMLFDEPTSALDPQLVGEVLDIMTTLASEGMTMIVATHEMKFAREVCDRVVYMENGRVVMQGAADAAFAHERIRAFAAGLSH
jgi:ABC-type polar amino acid transport system ATPase subunit